MRALIRTLVFPLSAAVAVATTPVATADPVIPLNWSITGTTTLAKPGLVVPIPAGAKFAGQIDLADWKITGTTTIPDLVVKGRLFNLLPYTAVVRQVSTKPLEGGIVDGQAKVTRYFRLKIVKLSLDATPYLNLVPPRVRHVGRLGEHAHQHHADRPVQADRDGRDVRGPVVLLLRPADANSDPADVRIRQPHGPDLHPRLAGQGDEPVAVAGEPGE